MAASSVTSSPSSFGGERFLLPILKKIHLYPNLPEVLHGLTFPELLPEPISDTIRLLEEYRELTPLFGELRIAYEKAPAKQTARLFALLSERSVLLFSIPKKGGEFVSIGVYATVGREGIFEGRETIERGVLERIFGNSPLFADRKEVQIEECTPFAALELWISPHLEEEESNWGVTLESERALSHAFEAAYDSGNVIEQIFHLEKLARIYFERENYVTTVHLLNGALALSESPRYRRLAFNRLERIESLFVSKRLGKELASDHCDSLMHHREELQRIRVEVSRLLDERKSIEEVQIFLTKSYKELLTTLINESIDLFGKAPEGFAVMGLGSMARGEISPYSDLEFAFLLRDSSPENLNYCRALDQLLVLKMINMGETKFPLIRSENRSLVPTGFSMDIGGICPSGKSGIYELIGTPEALAQLQKEEWLRDNDSEVILVNAMRTVCYIAGDESLVFEYQEKIDSVLDVASTSSSSCSDMIKLRQTRALELMQGFIDEFQPRLDQNKVNLRAFDAKKELYRPLQTVVSSLALYHELKSNNTLRQIDELVQKEVFNEDGALRLKRAFRMIFRLRITAQLFYKSEKEILHFPQDSKELTTQDSFWITQRFHRMIIAIYRTISPLHEKAKIFLQGDRKAFADCFFYDEAIGAYNDRNRINFELDSAFTSAVKITALIPNEPSTHSCLGRVQNDLGQLRKAAKRFKETLVLLKKKHGETAHLDVAGTLNNLGMIYVRLGEFQKAIDYLGLSLSMKKQLYGNHPHSDIAMTIKNIGIFYLSLGDFQRALSYSKSSLEMSRLIHENNPHSDIFSALINLGNVYSRLGEFGQAIKSYKDALLMKKQVCENRPDPETAMISNNLGNNYRNLGNAQRALKHYNHSLSVNKQIYGDRPHPDIAMVLMNLANVFNALQEFDQALEHHKLSLEMKKQIYKEKSHPDIANGLNNLSITYIESKNYSRAITCLNSALKMHEELYRDQAHPDTALTHMNLGTAFSLLKKFDLAINHYMISLRMRREIYNDQPHPETAGSLNNLGNAYKGLGNLQSAHKHYKLALEMKRRVYEDKPHPDIAKTLMNLGFISNDLHETSEATAFLAQSYEMYLKTQGVNHPNTRSVKAALEAIKISRAPILQKHLIAMCFALLSFFVLLLSIFKSGDDCQEKEA